MSTLAIKTNIDARGGANLFIVDGIEGYGIKRFLTSILSCSSQSSIILAIADGPLVAELRATGFRVLCLDLKHTLGVRSRGMATKLIEHIAHCRIERKALRRAVDMIQCGSIKSIHIGKPNALGLGILLARRLGGVPVHWMMHNALSDRYPFRLNARHLAAGVLRNKVHVMANSQYTASTFAPFVTDIDVVHLGLCSEWVRGISGLRSFERPVHWSSEDVVFGIFARLSPEKGHTALLDALVGLRNEVKWRLLVVGGPAGGSIESQMRQIARDYAVDDRLHFTGPVDDVRPFYPCIDIAINARSDPEPFGYSVIEAAAIGKPVIAVGLGGVREIFHEVAFGWLADNGTPKALQAAISEALTQRLEWASIAKPGAIITKFSEAAMREKYWTAVSAHKANIYLGEMAGASNRSQ